MKVIRAMHVTFTSNRKDLIKRERDGIQVV